MVLSASRDSILVLLRPARLDHRGRPEVRLPKGQIEGGETRHEAALREVSEETGISDPRILTDLGRQNVEFEWQGYHYVRDESCFLMILSPDSFMTEPERQFERLWLTWTEALDGLTYEAEKHWVTRALAATTRLASPR